MTASTSSTAALPSHPAGSYTGRFAPSPSGPLHMGSLVAALASYLDARAHNGQWLVRIEDLDPPREQAGADQLILSALETLGLHWDGQVLYQSQRHAAYEAAIEQLQQQHMIFYCRCSRRDLQDTDGIYPGTCRSFTRARPDSAIRCRVQPCDTGFEDCIQGPQQMSAHEAGDFIIRRRDGLFAYQLAVVVDDAWQGITHIIRGIDLLDSTPRQLYLQHLQGLPRPCYGHIPVLINDQGQKLSKQHHAPALDLSSPAKTLVEALNYLCQKPEQDLDTGSVDQILGWATRHWQRQALSGLRQLET